LAALKQLVVHLRLTTFALILFRELPDPFYKAEMGQQISAEQSMTAPAAVGGVMVITVVVEVVAKMAASGLVAPVVVAADIFAPLAQALPAAHKPQDSLVYLPMLQIPY
jgi:hypothetical protein